MGKDLINEKEKKYIKGLYEQTTGATQNSSIKVVSGPYNPVINGGGWTLYIVKHEQSMCRDNRRELTKGVLTPMTGSSCPQEFVPIPGNRFYIYYKGSIDNNAKIRMYPFEHNDYNLSTNNNQGFSTEEEAKKGISKIINPENKTGRNVKNLNVDGVNYKLVSKYDKQGNLIKVKSTSKDTNSQIPGKQRYRDVERTGL